MTGPSAEDVERAIEILGPDEAARVLADNRPSREERRRRAPGTVRRARMKHAQIGERRKREIAYGERAIERLRGSALIDELRKVD